jgi:uncharacterized protein (DUF2141 family)
MNTREHTWNGRTVFWWFIIIAVACLVYATGISHESFWYDEAYSAVMSGHSLGKIIAFTANDNHPPLYYLLLRMVRVVLGASEWALRVLSVIGAVALVGLGAGPVRRIFGNKTAFIYAAVTLFTPVVIIYAHEARMYTLAIFTVTAGVLYGYLAAHHNRTGDWICFGLATLAAAYLHYYGLIAAFYTHLFVCVWLLLKKRESMKAYLITGAVVLAGYLPWLIVFVKQIFDVNKGFWLGPVSIQAVLRAFYQPFVYKEFFPGIQPIMHLVLLVSLVLIVCGVVFAKKKKAENELTFSLFLLFVYFCTLITTIIVSLVLAPVFYPRYMIVCVGVFLLLLSLGISLLPGKFWQPAAVGIFALLNVFTLKDVYTQHFNHPMKKVARNLQHKIQPGDPIITSDSYSMGPALYYFPEAVFYYSNNSIEAQWEHVLKPFTPPLHVDEDLNDLIATHQPFWYITCNTGLSKNVSTILREEQGWEEALEPMTFSEPFSFVAFTVSKYVYTGRETTRQQGTLNVHITGLRPVGYLIAGLYNKEPIRNTRPYRFETLNVAEEELFYSFKGLEYGEYVLMLMHDENKNHVHDLDSKGQLPIEGVFVLNIEKLDPSLNLEDFTFDNLKFSFHEPERTIEAQMLYPPFTGQSNE